MSLLVVGSVAFDSVETPFGKCEEALGGSAMYFAASASFFTDVRMVGVVGEDFPSEPVDFLRRRRVDVDGLADLGVLVLNDPSNLAKALTKAYFQHLPEVVRPRTLITRDEEAIADFVADQGGEAVLKPLQGSGGSGVFKVTAKESPNLNQIVEAIARAAKAASRVLATATRATAPTGTAGVECSDLPAQSFRFGFILVLRCQAQSDVAPSRVPGLRQ